MPGLRPSLTNMCLSGNETIVLFSKDAAHGGRLTETEMANTEIGVSGGC